MPTITVYIAASGTAIRGNPDHPSTAGHMWFILNPGNGGKETSYGFGQMGHQRKVAQSYATTASALLDCTEFFPPN